MFEERIFLAPAFNVSLQMPVWPYLRIHSLSDSKENISHFSVPMNPIRKFPYTYSFLLTYCSIISFSRILSYNLPLPTFPTLCLQPNLKAFLLQILSNAGTFHGISLLLFMFDRHTVLITHALSYSSCLSMTFPYYSRLYPRPLAHFCLVFRRVASLSWSKSWVIFYSSTFCTSFCSLSTYLRVSQCLYFHCVGSYQKANNQSIVFE